MNIVQKKSKQQTSESTFYLFTDTELSMYFLREYIHRPENRSHHAWIVLSGLWPITLDLDLRPDKYAKCIHPGKSKQQTSESTFYLLTTKMYFFRA